MMSPWKLADAILSIGRESGHGCSTLDAGMVVRASNEVVRGIGRLLHDCWEDLSSQYEAHRANLGHYRREGGLYPDCTHLAECRGKAERLKGLMESISRESKSIPLNGWSYDIGFCKHIRSLRALIRSSGM